jgi:hypothetical protein
MLRKAKRSVCSFSRPFDVLHVFEMFDAEILCRKAVVSARDCLPEKKINHRARIHRKIAPKSSLFRLLSCQYYACFKKPATPSVAPNNHTLFSACLPASQLSDFSLPLFRAPTIF